MADFLRCLQFSPRGNPVHIMHAKILVVDDESDMVDLVAYNLRRRGHLVFTAATGQEGIACARQEHPDLIILDVTLSDMDGGAICELLQKSENTGTIPVLMLSNMVAEGVPYRGGDGFLRKPYKLQILLDQIEEMLSAHTSRENLQRVRMMAMM
jgi:DNA-binding response OmpR family regulator